MRWRVGLLNEPMWSYGGFAVINYSPPTASVALAPGWDVGARVSRRNWLVLGTGATHLTPWLSLHANSLPQVGLKGDSVSFTGGAFTDTPGLSARQTIAIWGELGMTAAWVAFHGTNFTASASLRRSVLAYSVGGDGADSFPVGGWGGGLRLSVGIGKRYTVSARENYTVLQRGNDGISGLQSSLDLGISL
jgi:hypothetical protein